VNATPKSTDSGFTAVRMGFRDHLPRTMILTDAFGQTTRLTFADIERNPALDASLFKFTPPQGADVIADKP
jgi:outer membrane lipoprotein-sorting protein